MRAIETGRTMLRATNTGMTAIVDPHGEVVARLPQFVEGILSAKRRATRARPRTSDGATRRPWSPASRSSRHCCYTGAAPCVPRRKSR